MEESNRIVEKDIPLNKDDLIVITGAAGRNSENTFIKKVLNWEPKTTLNKGLAETYAWITEQYIKRKAGERVGIG